MLEEHEAEFSRVRADHHFHTFALLSIAVWAATVWGWLWGLGVLAGLYIGISSSNFALIIVGARLRALRINSWLWLIAAAGLILVTSASIEMQS